MIQKVNPFSSSQPKVSFLIIITDNLIVEREQKTVLGLSFWKGQTYILYLIYILYFHDVEPQHNDLASSAGSLTGKNNLPEKQVDLCLFHTVTYTCLFFLPTFSILTV